MYQGFTQVMLANLFNRLFARGWKIRYYRSLMDALPKRTGDE